MSSPKSSTRTILASAVLLIVGVMACPNTPWEGGDPARELERMHARVLRDPVKIPMTLDSVNLLVHAPDGNPAPGVSVRICDPAGQVATGVSRERPGAVYYEGITAADGRCSTSIRLPASQSEFAVECSAPSASPLVARTVVQRHELAALELSLQLP